MGTRHLTIVVENYEPKIAQYGQWDGYPSGQGKTVLEFLKQCDLQKFKEVVKKCIFLSTEEISKIWESYGADITSQWVSLKIADALRKDFPELDRDLGAKILERVYAGEAYKLQNNIDFANDSLMCEWAYLIDLDRINSK